MGMVVQASRFSTTDSCGLFKPIIYCCQFREVVQRAVSIDTQLARALLDIQPHQRTLQMEKCFADVVAELPADAVIRDFDVMFNPTYQIDVLKILINVCRVKPFCVLWPGQLQGSRLIYAQAGYPDYKLFDIDHYDITLVV